MQPSIMVTDGGPHPAEKWAQVTASQIVDIASTAPDVLLREAREFEAKLIQLLQRHHSLVQSHERSGLDTHGPERLATDIDTSSHLGGAAREIIALAKGTSFEAHFAKPEVAAYLERVIHEHFHHSMHVERQWYAGANSDHPHAAAFNERVANGIGAFAGPAPSRKEN